MENNNRTELEQELVDAFVDSGAINFDAIGTIISKFGARAAKSGISLVNIVNKNISINCGWPGPEISRIVSQQVEGNS